MRVQQDNDHVERIKDSGSILDNEAYVAAIAIRDPNLFWRNGSSLGLQPLQPTTDVGSTTMEARKSGQPKDSVEKTPQGWFGSTSMLIDSRLAPDSFGRL